MLARSYIKTLEWSSLQPEVKQWEARQALDGGPDGLGLVRTLLSASLPWPPRPHQGDSVATQTLLRRNGVVWMELDVNQPLELDAMMQTPDSGAAWWNGNVDAGNCDSSEQLRISAVHTDFSNRARFVKLDKVGLNHKSRST